MGVEKGVCAVMGRYLRVRMFSLPADIVYQSFSK
jgi:hypothetical protein